MAVNEIKINTEELNSDIRALENELRVIETQMKSMYASVAELDQMWEGLTKDAIVRQFTIDHEDMELVCKMLHQLIEYLESASREYESGENEVSGLVSAIQV